MGFQGPGFWGFRVLEGFKALEGLIEPNRMPNLGEGTVVIPYLGFKVLSFHTNIKYPPPIMLDIAPLYGNITYPTNGFGYSPLIGKVF